MFPVAVGARGRGGDVGAGENWKFSERLLLVYHASSGLMGLQGNTDDKNNDTNNDIGDKTVPARTV